MEASPKANVLRQAEKPVEGSVPVYSLPSLHSPQESHTEKVAGLPTQPDDPWTVNLFLRCDNAPVTHTLLGGFGQTDDRDAQPGTGRYFVNFEGGLAFWLADADLLTHVKIEPKRWQMLTATFDGKTVTLYKDGAQIAAEERTLAPDVAKVGLGIADPWGRGNRFNGEIRDFKIWRAALTPEGVKALQQTHPQD